MATIYELLFLNLYTLINGECVHVTELDGCENWQLGGILSLALLSNDHCPKTSPEDALSIVSWGDIELSRKNPLEQLREDDLGYYDTCVVEFEKDFNGDDIECLPLKSYECLHGGYTYSSKRIYLRYEEDRVINGNEAEYYFTTEAEEDEPVSFYLISVKEFCNDEPSEDENGEYINIAEEYDLVLPAEIYDSFRD